MSTSMMRLAALTSMVRPAVSPSMMRPGAALTPQPPSTSHPRMVVTPEAKRLESLHQPLKKSPDLIPWAPPPPAPLETGGFVPVLDHEDYVPTSDPAERMVPLFIPKEPAKVSSKGKEPEKVVSEEPAIFPVE